LQALTVARFFFTPCHLRFVFLPSALTGVLAVAGAWGMLAAQEPQPGADSDPENNSPSVVASGAKLELLADSFQFTEGPISDTAGNVYFTDQPNDAIHVWSVDDQLSTFLKPSGRSNGLFFDAAGTLWACADEQNQLWAIAPDKSHRVVITDFEGQKLNGPNDLWVDPKGAIYFTDPFYKRPYWQRGGSEQPEQAVYRLDLSTGKVNVAARGLEQPNGIIGDAKRKLLFVADIRANKTYQYTISTDGTLVDRKLFCEAGSDGMTIDREGRIYLTGRKGVTVFDASGKELEVIAVPKNWTANVTFGGPKLDTLFITASDCLYRIKTVTRGLQPGKE
jgi:gluconolactonase